MSEANLFSRIISFRQIFRPPLLVATICAAISSILLAGLLLCVGAIAALVTVRIGSSGQAGLLPALRPDRFPDRLIHQAVTQMTPLHSNYSAVLAVGLATFILLLLRWALQAAISSRSTAYSSSRVRNLRRHIHRQSLRLNAGDLSGEGIETTRHLFRETADQLTMTIHRWTTLSLGAGADVAAIVITCCMINLYAGLEAMIPVVVAWFLLLQEKKRLSTTADLLAEQVDRSLNHLADGLEKSTIVAGYGMESFERTHFLEKLDRFGERRSAVHGQRRRDRWLTRYIIAFAVGAPTFVLLRHLLTDNDPGLSGVTMIAVGLILLYQKLQDLEAAHDFELAGNVAAEEIAEYIRAVPPVSQVVSAQFLEPMSRSLQFDQVCMDTADHPNLLTQLDLKIEAGQRVALVSLDPNEARGLVSLVPRLNDPTSGQILIDGIDINRVTLESLRAEAMVISGSNNLFNATVLENITCGQDDVSRQHAIDAGKVAHTEAFTRQLPRGYETVIGDFGVQLDTGQAFRLALARAIARKPALMFVEEPRETLDSETKTLLDDTYDRICQDRTVVFIPHRLSTVKKCERVILLNEGRVVADGTHDDLVRKSERYRHWEYMRFNDFRADQ